MNAAMPFRTVSFRTRLCIALVTETYPPEVNGVSLTVSKFAAGLKSLDHEVKLIRPAQGDETASSINDTVSGSQRVLCRSLPIPKYPDLRMGLPSQALLLKHWSARRPDVVHLATPGPLGWSALHAALKLGIPVCSDFRTNFHAYCAHYGLGWLRAPVMSYLRHFHNQTQATLVPTEHMRQELLSYRFNNLQIVARGVDIEQFSPRHRSRALRTQWGASDQSLVAIYVGRLAAEKNLQLLFAAFDAVRMRAPNARLVLVGDGPLRPLLSKAHPHAIFAGAKSGSELAGYFASADLFLFPSLTETFGNVTLEAMASGLAVVAFNYAAAALHIEAAQSGFLAEVGKEDHFLALSAGVASLAPHRLAAIRERACDAAANATWSRVVLDLERVLLRVSVTSNRLATFDQGRRPSDDHAAGPAIDPRI